MADPKMKPDKQSDEGNDQSEALQKILVSLEEDLVAMEASKKQRNLVSLVGLLLIILAIAMFMMNLSNFAKGKMNDNQFKKELLTKLAEDLKDVRNNPNLQGMIKDLKSEILPNLSKQIIKRFKEDVPQLKAKGEDFASELQHYLENDIKDKIVKSLTTSLLKVENIIKEKYPEISSDDLAKVLHAAQADFVIEITEVIESKIDTIRLDIDNLKASVSKFKDCEEYKKLDPANSHTMGHVKMQMVEAMLELVIFQINPEKGKDRVVVGGGK